jgi:hypothetical protein
VPQTPIERLFIVEATNWKEAVIKLLEPESAYAPWRCSAEEAEEGDAVAFVLNTDPTSVVTEIGHVGADGDPAHVVITPHSMDPITLVDLDTLVMMTGFGWNGDPRRDWVLRDEMALRMSLALEDCRYRGDQYTRYGRSPMAAARVLLHSSGRCAGCDHSLDLDFDDACAQVHIHTNLFNMGQGIGVCSPDFLGAGSGSLALIPAARSGWLLDGLRSGSAPLAGSG